MLHVCFVYVYVYVLDFVGLLCISLIRFKYVFCITSLRVFAIYLLNRMTAGHREKPREPHWMDCTSQPMRQLEQHVSTPAQAHNETGKEACYDDDDDEDDDDEDDEDNEDDDDSLQYDEINCNTGSPTQHREWHAGTPAQALNELASELHSSTVAAMLGHDQELHA
jgi:hypothetical protein